MSKISTFVFALIITLGNIASFGCSKIHSNNNSRIQILNGAQTQKSATPSGASTKNLEAKEILIVYFSMPETANPNNMTQEEANSTVVVNGKVLGNTQYLAYLIQENTGADIFRIEPKTPYPINHKALVDLAKVEQNQKARPELLAKISNIEQYNVIFLGYPTWWADMPMILYSFLEVHDFSKKAIIPFNTHGGNEFSDTINTIAALQPNANVIKNGFTVSRDVVQDSAEDVATWVKGLGY